MSNLVSVWFSFG